MAFGVVWLLLSTLYLGCVVVQSSEPSSLTDTHRVFAVVAGCAVWVCGVVLVMTFVVSMVRERYVLATFALVAPLVGSYAESHAATAGPGFYRPVLSVGSAVVMATVAVAVASAVRRALYRDRWVHHAGSHGRYTHRGPPIPV